VRKTLDKPLLWYYSYHVVDNKPRAKEREKKWMEVNKERGKGDVR
jgi:hypothetical protein